MKSGREPTGPIGPDEPKPRPPGEVVRAVGVDLGGTNVRAALVEIGETAHILDEAKEPLGDKYPTNVADQVAALVERVDPNGRRCAVGIGFAGMLRGWTGIVVNAPNFGWREVDFRGLLRSRLGPAVELYNDLNAIAYGERCYGEARGADHVLCVYVGTGVGAGLVTDGKLYIGATHLAGEMGHVKVVPGGRLCGCGQRGCVEAYVSGKNLAQRAREELAGAGMTSAVVDLAGGADKVHAGFLDAAAAAGDPYATALWDEVTPLLGMVLANAVTTLNPSHLVLGGGVWEGAPEFRARVLTSFYALVNAANADGLVVGSTTLGDDAGMLGAATLAARGEIHSG